MSVPSLEDMALAIAHQRALRREYGQFKAKSAIRHNGVLAYNPGDPVPAANVRKHGYLEMGLVEEIPEADRPPEVPEFEVSGDAMAVPTGQPVPKPRKNANLDAWTLYALGQQVTAERLAGLSRDEIAALFPED